MPVATVKTTSKKGKKKATFKGYTKVKLDFNSMRKGFDNHNMD